MINGMWIHNPYFFLKNSFWLSCKLHKPYLTLRPFGVQLFNLFVHYSSFFLSDSRSSTWTIRLTLNFQLLGDLLNSSVWEAIFVSNYFLKYNYQILLKIFHSMIAIDTCRKSPVTGNEDRALHQNMCYILRFFVHFFFCLFLINLYMPISTIFDLC